MKNFVIKLIATGLGLGYFPVASGTVGSLLGLVLFFGLSQISLLLTAVFTIILFFAGVATGTAGERLFAKKDPGVIVIDEIVGCLLYLLFSPDWHYFLGFLCPPLWYIITGFIIFRLFDIIKPYPARHWQDLPGGWGIMLDDIIAGAYTVIVIHFGIWVYNILPY